MIRVDVGHAVFGLVLGRDGTVVRAAPIAKYALGWSLMRALKHFAARGQVLVLP